MGLSQTTPSRNIEELEAYRDTWVAEFEEKKRKKAKKARKKNGKRRKHGR